MEVNVEYRGNSKFEVFARGHRMTCDLPAENGGTDTAMSPPELLLASLGTCASYYAAQYLQGRGLPSGELRVRVEAQKAKNPARLTPFELEVSVPGISEQHREGVLRAVKACLVHNTLLNSPEIHTVVVSSAPAVVPVPVAA